MSWFGLVMLFSSAGSLLALDPYCYCTLQELESGEMISSVLILRRWRRLSLRVEDGMANWIYPDEIDIWPFWNSWVGDYRGIRRDIFLVVWRSLSLSTSLHSTSQLFELAKLQIYIFKFHFCHANNRFYHIINPLKQNPIHQQDAIPKHPPLNSDSPPPSCLSRSLCSRWSNRSGKLCKRMLFQ